MDKPLVSVIIPAYNAARTVKVAVQSVIEQTVQNFEVIIVDDGSQDNTLAVARSIQDARVKVISQKNGGAAAARNRAITAAKGKYVALLDADDLWIPHKLERQLAILESGNNVYAVQSGAFFVDDNLEIISVHPCFPSQNALLETLLFQNMPNNMSTLVIKRSMLNEIGCFDTELEILEEWDMAIKVAKYCNLVSIEEPLSLYRVHSGNRSRNLDVHIKPGTLILQRLFQDPSLPESIKTKKNLIYSRFYTMLSGGCFKIGEWGGCTQWAAKALLTHPSSLKYIAALPLRRIKRRRSRQEATLKYNLDPNWLIAYRQFSKLGIGDC